MKINLYAIFTVTYFLFTASLTEIKDIKQFKYRPASPIVGESFSFMQFDSSVFVQYKYDSIAPTSWDKDGRKK